MRLRPWSECSRSVDSGTSTPALPPPGVLEPVIDRALEEDLGAGDVTTSGLIPAHLVGEARLVAHECGVLAGLPVAMAVFRRVDPSLRTTEQMSDGDPIEAGETAGTVSGSLASILMAERTALNFLQRMSGIATMTSKFVDAVSGTKSEILDTRKTAPGLRAMDKYAVAAGGGRNHRRNLGDGVLIKDNHIAALQADGEGTAKIIRIARDNSPYTLKIEIEVESVDEARAAIEGGADIVMLDNMSPSEIREAVQIARGRCLTEVSGGVTLDRVAEIAATGVDLISVGALTHSVKALDIGLDIEPVRVT